MRLNIFIALILPVLTISVWAADTPTAPPPKGTICFSNSIRNTDQIPISCKGLGKFSSIAEIYDRGFRVVSSGVIPEAGIGTVFLIIEERK